MSKLKSFWHNPFSDHKKSINFLPIEKPLLGKGLSTKPLMQQIKIDVLENDELGNPDPELTKFLAISACHDSGAKKIKPSSSKRSSTESFPGQLKHVKLQIRIRLSRYVKILTTLWHFP